MRNGVLDEWCIKMLLCAAAAAGGCAAPTLTPAVHASDPIVVGGQYERGAVHRALFGDGYRDLWTTPIEVGTLDLAATAGGLEPVMEVGSMQTFALAFESESGHSYTFRSLEKDPSRLLPWWLRVYPFAGLYRDQTAASFPGAPLVAEPLGEALGVLAPPVRLVRLPDDPALGEFRGRFVGLVGTFQEYPTAGPDGAATFGAAEILSTGELFERSLETGSDRPDARAYLRGRLLDLWIGDWDRHPAQYRWARRTEAEAGWLPIPEDRDGAFARYGGWVLGALGSSTERLVHFEARYPRGPGLFLQARNLDAWVLAGLARKAWEETVTAVVSELDDAALEAAVSRLPAAWRAERGDWLIDTLRARRAGLRAEAARFYERLAHDPRWVATTGADRLEGSCRSDGSLALRLIGPDGGTLLERRFASAETDTVHVWLARGADREVFEQREQCAIDLEIDPVRLPTEPPLDRGVPRWD